MDTGCILQSKTLKLLFVALIYIYIYIHISIHSDSKFWFDRGLLAKEMKALR